MMMVLTTEIFLKRDTPQPLVFLG